MFVDYDLLDKLQSKNIKYEYNGNKITIKRKYNKNNIYFKIPVVDNNNSKEKEYEEKSKKYAQYTIDKSIEIIKHFCKNDIDFLNIHIDEYTKKKELLGCLLEKNNKRGSYETINYYFECEVDEDSCKLLCTYDLIIPVENKNPLKQYQICHLEWDYNNGLILADIPVPVDYFSRENIINIDNTKFRKITENVAEYIAQKEFSFIDVDNNKVNLPIVDIQYIFESFGFTYVVTKNDIIKSGKSFENLSQQDYRFIETGKNRYYPLTFIEAYNKYEIITKGGEHSKFSNKNFRQFKKNLYEVLKDESIFMGENYDKLF